MRPLVGGQPRKCLILSDAVNNYRSCLVEIDAQKSGLCPRRVNTCTQTQGPLTNQVADLRLCSRSFMNNSG